MVHPFSFEQTKKTFRDSVVITDSLAAHTASIAMLGKDFLIVTRRDRVNRGPVGRAQRRFRAGDFAVKAYRGWLNGEVW